MGKLFLLSDYQKKVKFCPDFNMYGYKCDLDGEKCM